MLLATAETRRSIIDTELVEEPELERELPGEGTAGVAARDGGAEARGAPRRAKLKLFIIVSRAETRCRYSALAPVLEGATEESWMEETVSPVVMHAFVYSVW